MISCAVPFGHKGGRTVMVVEIATITPRTGLVVKSTRMMKSVLLIPVMFAGTLQMKSPHDTASHRKLPGAGTVRSHSDSAPRRTVAGCTGRRTAGVRNLPSGWVRRASWGNNAAVDGEEHACRCSLQCKAHEVCGFGAGTLTAVNQLAPRSLPCGWHLRLALSLLSLVSNLTGDFERERYAVLPPCHSNDLHTLPILMPAVR